MDYEASFEQAFRGLFIPVLLGAVAAFFYVAILARAHVKTRLLVGLYREAGKLRERQEEIKRVHGDAPFLARYQRLERGIEKLLEQEGLRPPRPAPPAPPRVRGR